MNKRHSVAVLLLLSTSMPQWAVAQDKDPVTETARRRFQEGVRFYDEKRFEEARAAFLQAYALKHHPAVLLNLAQSELRGNHALEAARHFASYLRESTSASASERAEAEKGLAAARAKIGRLQITVSTNGADVLVDNEPVGQSPLNDAVDVSPGAHAVEARFAGRSATAGATATAGKATPVSLSFEAPPPPSGPPTTVVQQANTAAEVPAPRPEEVVAPSAPSPPVASSDTHEAFFTWLGHSSVGLTGLGVTAIGLGLFAGFGVAGMKAADNADNVAAKIAEHGMQTGANRSDLCADPIEETYQLPCETLRDNMDKRDTDQVIATFGLVAAGVGLTTTVTAYFLTRKSGEPPTTSLTPIIGPRTTGIAIGGTF
jgi:hypothetical protein